jgi:hypothetical protein
MQVASGSHISGTLVAALEVLKQGDMAAVEAAVAALAWQQLATLDSSLLADLALLVADGHAAADGQAVKLYSNLLRHYAQVCACGIRQHLACKASKQRHPTPACKAVDVMRLLMV